MAARSRWFVWMLVVAVASVAWGMTAPAVGVVVSPPEVRFETAATVDMGSTSEQPIQVEAEWLDGDGHTDLVVLTQNDERLRTYKGNSEGRFTPLANQVIGSYAVEMIVHDFTGDWVSDYALLIDTGNPATSGVRIYEGDGAGKLTATVIDSFGFDSPTGFAIAQNDTDAYLDLVMTTDSGPLLFLQNDGSGTMSLVGTSSVGPSPTGVTSGYLDGDDKLDFVVTCDGDDSVYVYQGTRTAVSSQAGPPILVGDGASRPHIADLDGRHWKDIVVMNRDDDDVSVLLSDGNTYAAGSTRTDYPVASDPRDITVFRCDGDDAPDLAVARGTQGLVDVRLNDGSGSFGAARAVAGGTGPVGISAGDFDADGKTDLLAADVGDTSVRVLENTSRPTVHRLAGSDRYGTANAIAAEANPNGANTVVLATGGSYPDALAGVPLAAAVGAPVLLTPPDHLPGAVASRIKALGATEVYVLGGEGVVSQAVVQDLTDDGGIAPGDIERLGGADRYETCYLIAKELNDVTFGASSKAYVATGEDFPDALAGAGPAGSEYAPILLVRPDEVPSWTQQALSELGITQTVVLGGEGAVSAGVQASLPSPLRLDGPDRYATARAIADHAITQLDFKPYRTVIATGEDFPDALAAGPLCVPVQATAGPMMLVRRDGLPSVWDDFVSRWGEDMANVYVVGGEGAVSEDVLTEFEALY